MYHINYRYLIDFHYGNAKNNWYTQLFIRENINNLIHPTGELYKTKTL